MAVSGSNKPAIQYNIGDKVQYVRYVTRARNPVWGFAIVHRRTKNFTYIRTNSEKTVKLTHNDNWLYPHS
jgi:hypothetical protein